MSTSVIAHLKANLLISSGSKPAALNSATLILDFWEDCAINVLHLSRCLNAFKLSVESSFNNQIIIEKTAAIFDLLSKIFSEL